MATYTTRLAATKPASSENVSITTLNNDFDLFDAAVGATVAASTALPASAFSGRLWYETDTRRFKVNAAASASTAADWQEVSGSLNGDSIYLPDYGLTQSGSTANSVAGSAAYAAAAAARSVAGSAYFGANGRGTKIIDIPAGTYKFTANGSLLHDRGIARTDGLTYRGSGRDVTNIIFEPAASGAYLLDNNDDWLHVTFEDLTFFGSTSGGASGSFMKSTSSGGAQNYVFNRVNWAGTWLYGIDLQGTNTNSELSWYSCGIYDNWTAFLYASASTSDQFLNYHFYACNPEMDTGNFIDLAKGGNVNVYGGSFIHRGSGAVDQTFFKLRGGDHSSGVMRLYVNGVRVEHQHIKSHLIESEWKRGSITFECIDTESHAFLLGSASTLPQATFQGDPDALPQIMWRDCVGLFGKHSYQFNSGSWNRRRQITYDNCELALATSAHDFITIVNNGGTANVGGTPPVRFTNSRSIDSSGGNPYLYPIDCNVGWELTKNASPEEHRVSIKTADGSLPNVAAGTQEVWLPKNSVVTNIRFYMPATGSSTSTTWTYTVKTSEGSPTTLATANPGTQWKNGFSVSTDTWFMCDSDAKRHLKLDATVITELSTSSLCVVTYLA